MWSRQYSSAEIEHQLKVAHATVTDWSRFCRELINDVVENSTSVGRPVKIVELDESKFGKRKYNRGKRIQGQWVFGGIDRESGNCSLVPAES